MQGILRQTLLVNIVRAGSLTFIAKVADCKDGHANVVSDERLVVERLECVEGFEEADDDGYRERKVCEVRLERCRPGKRCSRYTLLLHAPHECNMRGEDANLQIRRLKLDWQT